MTLVSEIVNGETNAITLTFGEFQPVSVKPKEAGIFCVYRADAEGRPGKLLYVGETGDLNTPISDRCRDWHEKEEPVYCLAPLKGGKEEILRAKAALICKFAPEHNENSKDSFNYGKTVVLITGGKFSRQIFTIGHNKESE